MKRRREKRGIEGEGESIVYERGREGEEETEIQTEKTSLALCWGTFLFLVV